MKLKFKFKEWEVEFYKQNEIEILNYLICLSFLFIYLIQDRIFTLT